MARRGGDKITEYVLIKKNKMATQLETWKLLTMDFSPELNDALQQQHHAAQYIALVGRHLIPQKSDDSNTNMEFVPEKGMLIGNPLSNGMKVGLQLSNLELTVLDAKNNTLETISFDGKSKKQAFAELKSTLSSLRIDTSNFTDQLHYEIPTHPLDNGALFSVQNEKYFIENLNYRHNARLVLTEIAANIDNAEAVKIWPHHFDTGSFISFSKNEKGEVSQTIGLGFAIPDSMVDEPYYYLSFWSEEQKEKPNAFSPLKNGKWMVPTWNGAVLPLSDILNKKSATEQYNTVETFFTETIDIVVNYLKNR